MRASLADQDQGRTQRLAAAVSQALVRDSTLAIALGANLPSHAGSPVDTLMAVRPLLEGALQQWLLQQRLEAAPSGERLRALQFHWSPLLETAPVGGPEGQNNYVNGALLVEGCGPPQPGCALELLQALQQLETSFGRRPLAERERWGPRSLDLDWLWWGELDLNLPATAATPALQLPHPLWQQRLFVLEPLMALITLTRGG